MQKEICITLLSNTPQKYLIILLNLGLQTAKASLTQLITLKKKALRLSKDLTF
jgi:hypothetical protein